MWNEKNLEYSGIISDISAVDDESEKKEKNTSKNITIIRESRLKLWNSWEQCTIHKNRNLKVNRRNLTLSFMLSSFYSYV